jgi:CheY-like chemotaxis protein
MLSFLSLSEKQDTVVIKEGGQERGKTVLVVDDNAAVRRTLARAFLFHGFKTCIEAENGKEAIEVAQRTKPDVITLDLAMPVMDGMEAAPQLRRLLPTTPIILLTLYADSVHEEDVSKAGINLVLSKTEDPPKIVDKAHQLVGH